MVREGEREEGEESEVHRLKKTEIEKVKTVKAKAQAQAQAQAQTKAHIQSHHRK